MRLDRLLAAFFFLLAYTRTYSTFIASAIPVGPGGTSFGNGLNEPLVEVTDNEKTPWLQGILNRCEQGKGCERIGEVPHGRLFKFVTPNEVDTFEEIELNDRDDPKRLEDHCNGFSSEVPLISCAKSEDGRHGYVLFKGNTVLPGQAAEARFGKIKLQKAKEKLLKLWGSIKNIFLGYHRKNGGYKDLDDLDDIEAIALNFPIASTNKPPNRNPPKIGRVDDSSFQRWSMARRGA